MKQAGAVVTYQKPTLREWLSEAPFTLALSSGFFGFYAHFGVLKALAQEGLEPARYCGSSAGALIAGCAAAAHTSLETLERELLALRRDDFWDPSPGLGLLAGKAFRARLRHLIGTAPLEDLPCPAALSVWVANGRETRVLKHGNAVEAVYASCAVPLLFQPGNINGKYAWDGGIGDRHGLSSTRHGERVLYHHLVSRSPWRRANSPALHVPARDNLQTLAIEDLPRSGPNKLDKGPLALALAYEATLAALQQPIR